MKKTIVTAATLTMAALMLTACGSSQPAQQTTAATTVAETTTVQETTTVAETTKAIAPVVGRWKMVKMVTTDGKESVEQDAPAETYYTFEEDGTLVALDNGQTATGTWKEAAPDTYAVNIKDTDMTFTINGDDLIYQYESAANEGVFNQFIFNKE